nr:MAG: PEGA domain-containing protein [Lentisphaerota bacterium]
MSQPGSLRILSDPNQASVYVNGKITGETPLTLRNLTPGIVSIRVTKDGYSSVLKRIQVLPGITKDVNIKLVSKYGSLVVTTEPSECRVLVDGALRGMTIPGDVPGISKPMHIEKLSPGVHNLVIEKPGFQTVSKQVVVAQGEKTVLKPIKLPVLWLPTHVLRQKGSLKSQRVKVISKSADKIEVEMKKGKSIIRYSLRQDQIDLLQPIK